MITIKDLVLDVPYLARDVDIIVYKEHMAKIELYINLMKTYIDDVQKEMDKIVELYDPDIEHNFIGFGSEEPEDPQVGMIWFDTSE